MNLYLISQKNNNDYDTFDSAVVCANSEYEASRIHPSYLKKDWNGEATDDWCFWQDVSVEKIGVAGEDIVNKGVVLSSFNAG